MFLQLTTERERERERERGGGGEGGREERGGVRNNIKFIFITESQILYTIY